MASANRGLIASALVGELPSGPLRGMEGDESYGFDRQKLRLKTAKITFKA
ncbi:hypothetical protein [Amycolatopsis eburnea]|nr:hypothetical protein [Amycolatopsis eburnea]